jgi:hypothetical protein
MDNYDFIERRIRFLRWVFSKEEPWRNYKRLGSSLTSLFNHELTFDGNLAKHIADNLPPSYLYGTANDTISGSGLNFSTTNTATLQSLLQIITTATASANISITYSQA